MIHQDLFRQLWEKYLADQKLTAGEIRQLKAFVQDERHQQQLDQMLASLYSDTHHLPAATETSSRDAFEEVWTNLEAAPATAVPVVAFRRRMQGWKYAAAVLVLLSSAAVFYWVSKDKSDITAAHQPVSTGKAIIQPGGNKALLTLADGSVIALNDAQNGTLAKQGNTEVVKLANGQLAYQPAGSSNAANLFNKIVTPRGGKYNITLPDGSKVWLNAASSLHYPTTFSGNSREVTLTGEAYFEIAENRKMPFRVNVNNVLVDVLGTHFNVMAYADEEAIHATLLEGCVRVSNQASEIKSDIRHQQISKSVVLLPGQRATVSGSALTVQSDVDTEETIAWKNNMIQFAGADIRTVMRTIARWYDVEVEYRGNVPNAHFRGGLSSTAPVSEVLNLMQRTGEVHFEISNRTIIVKP